MSLHWLNCFNLDMIIEISKFIAEDGKAFDTKGEAVNHENKIRFNDEFNKIIVGGIGLLLYDHRHKIKD